MNSDALQFVCPNAKREYLLNRLQIFHPFPLGATILLTEKCNLKCGHCYITKRVSSELSTSELANLLEELADCGVIKVFFSGGEPLSRPDFIEIFEEAARLRFQTVVKTNATYLDRFVLSKMIQRNLSELHISMYSSVPEEHDRFVGMDGAFHRAVLAMKQFRDAGRTVIVNMVAMNWNVERVPEIINLCKKEDWLCIADFKLTHRLDGACEPLSYLASPSVLENALLYIIEKDPQGVSLNNHKNLNSDICGLANSGVAISSSGDVLACARLLQPMGNIRESRFRDIWLHSKVRKEMLSLKWGGSKLCRECNVSWACNRCPGAAVMEHGDINRPATTDCIIANAKAAAYLKHLYKKGIKSLVGH